MGILPMEHGREARAWSFYIIIAHFGPKARNMTAQGNALGKNAILMRSPEGTA